MILDGHKSHINLKLLQKVRTYGSDMVSLPFHISHAIQRLNVACFGPFKKNFGAYRDLLLCKGVEN